MTLWFRRAVWFTAIGGWLIVIVAGLLTTATPGEIIAFCILAVMTFIAIFWAFAFKWGIRRKIRRHLAISPKDASLLQHPLTPRSRIDVIRGLYAYSKRQPRFECIDLNIGAASVQVYLESSAEPQKLQWESCQTDVKSWEEIPINAVFLLSHDDVPFVAAVTNENGYSSGYDFDDSGDETHSSRTNIHLQILAVAQDQCHRIRDFLLELAVQNSVYRRRKIIVRASEKRGQSVAIEFASLTQVPRERVILPEQIFEIVHRAAMKQLDLEDVLRRAGHRTRTAVLLHGPPGTGKTLLLKHLVGTRDDTTTIMLHGFRRGLVREAFRLARYCQPSIVLIEDVDLIAVRRQRSTRGTSLLHELLDELDGLAPESRTVVLMTTNRPDVLEPALASRPGRISQAIEIPLPDAECRLRTLRLFTANLDVTGVELSDWVSRTEGASPAFLEELIRRAILFAVDRPQPELSGFAATARTSITDEDLSSAMNEILTSGGRLTRRLLGYQAE